MICQRCSTAVPEGSSFCPTCGGAVRQASKSTSDSSLPTIDQAPPSRLPRSREEGEEGRFLPGQILASRYRIVGLVGRGGMGQVYRADDLKLGQTVALKFLPPELEQDPGRLVRLLGEVRIARQISHPSVCRVYDVGESQGQHFLSMEFVDGEDLASLLRRIGRVPQDRAIEMARQICAGLAAAHAEGILHRDLKPANIMVDGRGRVRITDFGLAGIAEDIDDAEMVAGTPAYMSPEQLEGKALSTLSDIYSLGLVLFELFTGRPAFQPGSFLELKDQRLESQPSSPSSILDGLDTAVDRVISSCLETDPGQRPSSALAVAAALPGGNPLEAAMAAGETPSPEMVAESGSSESMRPALALMIALAGLAVFIAGTYWQGTYTMLAYLPVDLPPAAQIVGAREMIREFGYTGAQFSEPRDSAYGFFAWRREMEMVARSAGRDGLRSRPDLMFFWYRQSPRNLYPRATAFGTFAGRYVGIENPPPQVPGELLVLLDGAGKLTGLRVIPSRYSTSVPADWEPDWEQIFSLAGLDLLRFTPVTPRIDPQFSPDRRWAWTGSRASAPGDQWRVEAASSVGRLSFFFAAPESRIKATFGDAGTGPGLQTILFMTFLNLLLILLIAVAIFLARRNWVRGRCDRRGAARLALLLGGLTLLEELLWSHGLFTRGGIGELWLILATALVQGAVVWLFYLAAEPYARRVWPSLFISSSRLLSRQRIRWKDALVGRSVLAGVLIGATTALVYPTMQLLLGSPAKLFHPPWDAIVSQRAALAKVIGLATVGPLSSAALLVLVLVALLRLTKNRKAAISIGLLVWTLFGLGSSTSPWVPLLVFSAIAVFVLLRFGVLAVVVFLALDQLYLCSTTDLTAWHSQPGLFATLIVAALAGYGFWAATAGKRLFSDDGG